MGSVSIDPTIYIQPSQELISLVCGIPDLPNGISKVQADSGARLTTQDIKWIREHLSKEEKSLLYSALRSCKILVPSPVFPDRDPDLEKRCQKLRLEQDNRDYKKMTRNIRESELREKPLSQQFEELNGVLMMLVQFLVSVLASFMFGYLAPYYLYGYEDTGPRIIFGTLVAFFVGIADLYFVIREHLRDDGIKLAKKIE